MSPRANYATIVDMINPPFEESLADRWFGIQCNNQAWDFVQAASRSPDEVERMIHAAHASCHHWLQVGEPVHHLRALCLLATAYAVANLGEASARHAERALELLDQPQTKPTPFDRALAHGCAATALGLLGDQSRSQAEVLLARRASELIKAPEDRQLLLRLHPVLASDESRP